MKIKIIIQRQEDAQSQPYTQSFLYEGSGAMTVADFLAELNTRDPLLTEDGKSAARVAYQTSCHEKKCGACAMLVNGAPRLACSVFLSETAQKNGTVSLAPLSRFPVVRDLITDRAAAFAMLETMKVWLSRKDPEDKGWDRRLQYQAGQCLACGCCLEVCPNYYPGAEFGGMAAMNPAVRVMNGTEGKHLKSLRRSYVKTVYDGCGKSLACRDICPAGVNIEKLMTEANHDLRKSRAI